MPKRSRTDERRQRMRGSLALQERARQLRREMTPAERKLWQRLRRGQLDGAHFRRQSAARRFVLDFVCTKAKLVVEVDGDVHSAQAEYDAERTQWLATHKGYRVLRVTNADVHGDIESVVEAVRAVLNEPQPPTTAASE